MNVRLLDTSHPSPGIAAGRLWRWLIKLLCASLLASIAAAPAAAAVESLFLVSPNSWRPWVMSKAELDLQVVPTVHISPAMVVGPLVWDHIVKSQVPLDFPQKKAGKVTTNIETRLGGAAHNIAKQFLARGAAIHPVFFVGDDYFGAVAGRRVHKEFAKATVLKAMAGTRSSLIIGDATFTSRPRLTDSVLPDFLTTEARRALPLVIAPAHPEDNGVVRELLAHNPNTVLMQTSDQLREKSSFELAAMAGLVVVNDEELRLWTGKSDIVDGINFARDRGVKGLVVTAASGVFAYVDDDWHCVPAFKPHRVRRTSGAGDVFLGSFLSFRSDGESIDESLKLAQGAATLYIEETGLHGNRTAIQPGLIVLCPEEGGEVFTMGVPADECPEWDAAAWKVGKQDNPEHEVNLTTYALHKFCVTNASYELFDSRHVTRRVFADKVKDISGHPAVDVSWYDAWCFAAWLGEVALDGRGYAICLPTESEWEYACRCGERASFTWGGGRDGQKVESEYCNFDTTDRQSQPPAKWPDTDRRLLVARILMNRNYRRYPDQM
jgi:sugar/nucleoside kinase (ribokinase family)